MCVMFFSTDMNCTEDIDECASNPCLNGATCQKVFIAGILRGYTCQCTADTTGNFCETSEYIAYLRSLSA